MTARLPDLDNTDERLREWAHFFRDHKFREHCRSIEHRYQATSEDFGPDGWGDSDAAPQTRPSATYALRRALETHEAIQQLDRIYKWALTYGYCYPGMPKFVVLRCMKKFTGRRLNWKAYLDMLDIGRCRVHTTISCAYPIDSAILFVSNS
jgi:hypothetical protein